MEYRLRQATDEDYEFLYNLNVTTLRDAVEAMWGWDEAFQRRHFDSHFDPASRQIIVLAGRDVGVLVVEERPGETFLALIEVAPAYQNQGLGTRVVRDVLARAHGRGRPVTLTVLKTNPRAHRLYERLGFAVYEEREERYLMRAAPPEQ